MTIDPFKLRRRLRLRLRLRKRIREFMKISAKVAAGFAEQVPDACFVQIGVNDGDQQDPFTAVIESSSWHGVMVEPVPYVFERLKHNKDNLRERVKLANVAIAAETGVMEFWYLPEDDELRHTRKLYDALGSFRKEVVLKHGFLIPDIEDRIASISVPTLSFDALCEEFGIDQLDVIQIDTEGYDFEIIKRINFGRWRPKLMIYEHLHLSVEDRVACTSMLEQLGYDCYEDDMDVVCVDAETVRQVMPEFHAQWHSLTRSRQLARRLGFDRI